MQSNRETFRAIESYPKYEVSSHGRVRNVITNKFLKGLDNGHGYLFVKLNKKIHYIHRLVATTFLDLPDDEECKNVIDHIDGDKKNNYFDNLRFCNIKENLHNSKKRKGKSKYRGVCSVGKRFVAYFINKDGKQRHIGYFDDEETCAKKRDEAILCHYGKDNKFIKLNFPLESETHTPTNSDEE